MRYFVWWQFQTTLTVIAMVVLVVLACRFFRRWPAVQHALWLIVLVKFLLPPIVDWPWTLNEMVPASAQQKLAVVSPAMVIADRSNAPLPDSPIGSRGESTRSSLGSLQDPSLGESSKLYGGYHRSLVHCS